MNSTNQRDLRSTLMIALFTALIIVGNYLVFPLPFSPVPLVLADFFVMLAGLCLGAKGGLSSIGFFIFLGALGLPVFAGGKGGLAVLIGPTGGFLWGYLVGVYLIGLISHIRKPHWLTDLLALISGNSMLFVCGIVVLKIGMKINWGEAIAAGLIPFIPGNIIKTTAAVLLIQAIRPMLQQNS